MRPQRMVFLGQKPFLPGVAIAPALADRDAIVGQLMAVNPGQQFGATPHVAHPLAQQRTHRAQSGRIGVGRGYEIGTEQMREFLGVDPVIFVFAAVNGSDIEGMGQDEAQARFLAGIGQPVPAEHAFATHRQAVPVGLDQLKEKGEVVVFDIGVHELFALAIHDADVHLARMQIDFRSCIRSWRYNTS